MAVIAISSALGMLVAREMHKYHPVLLGLAICSRADRVLDGGAMIQLADAHAGHLSDRAGLDAGTGPHLINGLYDMIENNMQTDPPPEALPPAFRSRRRWASSADGSLCMTTVPPSTVADQPIPFGMDIVLAGVASVASAPSITRPGGH
ncbi:MAG: hypothetical protein IPL70_19290 [Uliginosibacterium sp.]|nr:hypothetical protein [Uliginosibacterium sp.]